MLVWFFLASTLYTVVAYNATSLVIFFAEDCYGVAREHAMNNSDYEP